MGHRKVLPLRRRSTGQTARPSPTGRRRGRPHLIAEAERRDLVLSAAEQVFVELGYTAASMDDIARRARMSKKTLYRFFETKEALFAAVIAARRAELDATIDSDDVAETRPPETVLRLLLTKVACFVLAPRQAALYRLVLAESHRAPELARAFHHDGPNKACQMLNDWLASQHARGNLHIADPSSAAGMLFSMVVGEPQMRVLVGDCCAPERDQIEQRVAQAVELFMRGARPDKKVRRQIERG